MTRRKTEENQERALIFIRAYREAEGISPTVREVSAYLGLSSSSSGYKIIRDLEDRDLITRKRGCPRSITLKNDGTFYGR